MQSIEVVAKTEYQDIYRLKHSALLVVDKFDKMYPDYPVAYFGKKSLYDPNTKGLYITKDRYKVNDKEFVKAGTVISYVTPVISTSDKAKWRYKIKTSGEYFNGNASEMLKMLSEIENIIRGEL